MQRHKKCGRWISSELTTTIQVDEAILALPAATCRAYMVVANASCQSFVKQTFITDVLNSDDRGNEITAKSGKVRLATVEHFDLPTHSGNQKILIDTGVKLNNI